jgi:signal transduction histidine kinase
MKRFSLSHLDSITLRVAGVLLLGLLAAQWTAERLYQEERQRVMSHLIAGPLAKRLETVVDKLEHTPQAQRPELLRLLTSPRITFRLAETPPARPVSGALAVLQTRLRDRLGEARRVAVMAAGPGAGADELPDTILIALTLRDGQVLLAEHHYPDDPRIAPSRHLPLLTGYFLVIALLALLALGWAVRPLRRLARAADALGRDLGGAPLPETGPREVRQAAHAFNTMQNRLASFLEDRLRILAAVSHDLKSPITRLKMRAELLPDAGQRDKILGDLEDMETMIGATLDFLRGEARQEAGVPVDVNALLSTLRDDFEALGGSVRISGQATRPLIARPQALKRCLANLLDNAQRYGGGASLAVQDGPHELVLSIDDSGPGLPEADLERMFEPFRRGEASRSRATGGTGLGLAIARNLARAHGGEVSLTNRPEGGLRATVRLPRGA